MGLLDRLKKKDFVGILQEDIELKHIVDYRDKDIGNTETVKKGTVIYVNEDEEKTIAVGDHFNTRHGKAFEPSREQLKKLCTEITQEEAMDMFWASKGKGPRGTPLPAKTQSVVVPSMHVKDIMDIFQANGRFDYETLKAIEEILSKLSKDS